ncbi:MAG: hypothetical protein ACOYMM_03155 [Phycisphaerales bacterium]
MQLELHSHGRRVLGVGHGMRKRDEHRATNTVQQRRCSALDRTRPGGEDASDTRDRLVPQSRRIRRGGKMPGPFVAMARNACGGLDQDRRKLRSELTRVCDQRSVDPAIRSKVRRTIEEMRERVVVGAHVRRPPEARSDADVRNSAAGDR